MNIVRIRMTFAVALVLVVPATGLWAGGAGEAPAAVAEKEMVTRPQHRGDGGGTAVWWDINLYPH